MTDKYQRLRDALAAGEFDYGQVCCGDGVWSGHPDEPPECCGQPLTLADDIRALLDRLKAAEENVRRSNAQAEHFEREWYLRGDEIERLRGALAIARDYVADEIAYLRNAFRGHEALGKVPEAEADLARIDAAIGDANAR